jgi:NitT/TauT family transport system permease protein
MIKLLSKKGTKRVIFLLVVVVIWETVFRLKIFPPLLFPAPLTVAETLVREITDGSLLSKAAVSLYMVFLGLIISILIVFVLTVLSMLSKSIHDLSKTLITVLDPLPGVALLPLAILWFGIGRGAILFVMVHSILWPVLLNVLTGFDMVPAIYKELGMGLGLSKVRMVTDIYIPAALPSILSGLKTGWSRAWRALIAAEMVFGAVGRASGLGWDIYIKRGFLDMPGMFASLIVIMIIGILIEDLFFKRVEDATIRKWGMTQ